MTTRVDPKVFLQRRSYRRRRMLDGIKMLPIAGAWLFLMPILWAQGTSGEGTGGGLSAAVVYIFCVWMCLIFFAFLFLRAYRQLASDEDGDAIVAVAGDTEAE